MSDKVVSKIIWVVSIVVPVLVAILLFVDLGLTKSSFVSFLPSFHAGLNGSTSIILLLALSAIKNGNVELHKRYMTSAFILGGIFLLSYVVYHTFGEKIIYGDVNHDLILSDQEKLDAGTMRYVYYFVLISHILCSLVVLPLVLFSFSYSLSGNFDKHKKLVKFSFPIWLYVSVTGVLVYILINPYYI